MSWHTNILFHFEDVSFFRLPITIEKKGEMTDQLNVRFSNCAFAEGSFTNNAKFKNI